jgi:hypothetical protein
MTAKQESWAANDRYSCLQVHTPEIQTLQLLSPTTISRRPVHAVRQVHLIGKIFR